EGSAQPGAPFRDRGPRIHTGGVLRGSRRRRPRRGAPGDTGDAALPLRLVAARRHVIPFGRPNDGAERADRLPRRRRRARAPRPGARIPVRLRPPAIVIEEKKRGPGPNFRVLSVAEEP